MRLTRFRNLWRGAELDRDFDQELRFHFDMRVERNLRSGMTRADAEVEARRTRHIDPLEVLRVD